MLTFHASDIRLMRAQLIAFKLKMTGGEVEPNHDYVSDLVSLHDAMVTVLQRIEIRVKSFQN